MRRRGRCPVRAVRRGVVVAGCGTGAEGAEGAAAGAGEFRVADGVLYDVFFSLVDTNLEIKWGKS